MRSLARSLGFEDLWQSQGDVSHASNFRPALRCGLPKIIVPPGTRVEFNGRVGLRDAAMPAIRERGPSLVPRRMRSATEYRISWLKIIFRIVSDRRLVLAFHRKRLDVPPALERAGVLCSLAKEAI
jgi:hypothetical protein